MCYCDQVVSSMGEIKWNTLGSWAILCNRFNAVSSWGALSSGTGSMLTWCNWTSFLKKKQWQCLLNVNLYSDQINSVGETCFTCYSEGTFRNFYFMELLFYDFYIMELLYYDFSDINYYVWCKPTSTAAGWINAFFFFLSKHMILWYCPIYPLPRNT